MLRLKKKAITILIIMTLMILSIPTGTIAGSNYTVTVNGSPVAFSDEIGRPFIDSTGRTQVPFRAVLEKFGAEVSWADNTATAKKGYISVSVPVGKSYILKNGVKIPIDTSAQNINGRVYLPIRHVIEAFGSTVEWKGAEKLIEIKAGRPYPATDIVPENISTPDFIVSNEDELTNALKSGGTIKLASNIVVKNILEVSKPAVIDGSGFIIDGDKSSRIFKVNQTDLTLQNITLQNGKNTVKTGHFSDQCGAAVMVSGYRWNSTNYGKFKAVNVNFIDNECEKESNLGDIRGGAVYLFNVPDAEFSNCLFTGNKASSGGAIGGLGSSLKVVNCNFIANHAQGVAGLDGTGGAISLDGIDQNGKTAYFEVVGSTFTGNTGDRNGGAIYYVFHKPGDKGYNMNSSALFKHSTFEYNELVSEAEGQGGAVYAQEGDLNVDSCTFLSNRSFKQGGGLWFLSYTGKLDVTNSTFEGNSVVSTKLGMGGALALTAVSSNITNTTIANNYAWFHGAGIQAADGKKVQIKNCILSNNRSERDWAVYNVNTTLEDGGGNIEYLSPSITNGKKVKNVKVAATSTSADPKLLPLAYNGGYTKTMALESSSPAINRAEEGAPTIDQRGVARVGKADVGAYEHD